MVPRARWAAQEAVTARVLASMPAVVDAIRAERVRADGERLESFRATLRERERAQ
jgi:hypothetical protein